MNEDQDYLKIDVIYSDIIKRLLAQIIDILIYLFSIFATAKTFQYIFNVKIINRDMSVLFNEIIKLETININTIVNLYNSASFDQLLFYLVIIPIVWLIVIILPQYLTNQTFGKMFLQIRIVDISSANISFIKSVFRESLGKLITLISIVGIFFPLFKKRNESLHDIIFSTYVVDLP
ncbi:MAG: RDD family protein [Oligoflexia bacterium]|nr:RDD family protein [Oligoflexia bacterium]